MRSVEHEAPGLVQDWFDKINVRSMVDVRIEDGLTVVCFKNSEEQQIDSLITVTKRCKITAENRNVPIEAKWISITAQDGDVILENVYLKCKLQVLGGANVKLVGSTLTNTDAAARSAKQEPCIEVFSRGSASFRDCAFVKNKCAVAVRDNGKVKIDNCVFVDNNVSVMLMDSSNGEVVHTEFRNNTMHCIYSKSSKCLVESCKFEGSGGKCVLAMSQATVDVKNCEFKGYKTGAVTSGESTVCVESSEFIDGAGVAAQALVRGRLEISSSRFWNCAGNAIQFMNGNGKASDCAINNTTFPAIVANGPMCKEAEIVRCSVVNCKGFGIIARDESSPTIVDCEVIDIESDACSFSDKSSPRVVNLRACNITGSVFNVFNGSTPEIVSFTSQNCNIDVTSFLHAKPHLPCECKYVLKHKGIIQIGDDVIENHETCDINYACLECGTTTDMVRMPCGHRVCASCLEKSPNMCTACNISCTMTKKVFMSDMCIICREDNQVPDMLIIPCGHKCICKRCYASAMTQLGPMKECPTCRQKVTVVRHELD